MYAIEVWNDMGNGLPVLKMDEFLTASFEEAVAYVKEKMKGLYCAEPTLEDIEARPLVTVPHLLFYGPREPVPAVDVFVHLSDIPRETAKDFYRAVVGKENLC